MTESPGPRGPVRRRVLVSGRVQGVFFRDSARQRAARLGVSGWARNLPDGRVELVLEGSPEAVEELRRWCAAGPPAARVDGMQVHDEPPEGLTGFRTR